MDISKTTTNRFLYCLDYIAPLDGLYVVRHQQVADEEQMLDLTSQVIILTWIEEQVSLQSVEVYWVIDLRIPISTDTFTFSTKF